MTLKGIFLGRVVQFCFDNGSLIGFRAKIESRFKHPTAFCPCVPFEAFVNPHGGCKFIIDDTPIPSFLGDHLDGEFPGPDEPLVMIIVEDNGFNAPLWGHLDDFNNVWKKIKQKQ